MRSSCLITVVLLLTPCVLAAQGVDLTKIERTIAKEPPYKGQPTYCLLVFGPEARFRVWLVLDDEALYVDRNGTGDLTDKAKRLPFAWKSDPKVRRLQIGDVATPDWKIEYTRLFLARSGAAANPMWAITAKGKHLQSTMRNAESTLEFGQRAEQAPVVHFDGPLTLELAIPCGDRTSELVRDGKPHELVASLGTLGLGKGSFAFITSGSVPGPLAEIEFPHRTAGQKPILLKAPLAQPPDSSGCGYMAQVRVPEEAAIGKAKVRLSFPDSKEAAVAPRTIEVPVVESKPKTPAK